MSNYDYFHFNCSTRNNQLSAHSASIETFIPPKSAQVNFLWGKNDARTAIQQFYTPPQKKKKNFYTLQNKFLAMPLVTLH